VTTATTKRWLLAALCAGALAAQTWRALRLLEASRILHAVQTVSVVLVQRGGAPPPLLVHNLELLGRAERLDPSNGAIPLARGSQLLLLHRPQEARTAYLESMALEPRAEVYLNLGRALRDLGQTAEAAAARRRAVLLHPQLRAAP
jgi:tetratricopeptide (TPR) repeat protein